ncbi:MAG: dihydropteroate synthase [Myxococcota bacterium]
MSTSGARVRCGFREFLLGTRTHVLGVVNVTPDSFSDGGHTLDVDRAIQHGTRMMAEGADIVDVGGESTRPGAVPVGEETEIARVVPVIEGLVRAGVTAISVDTRNAATARAAVRAGARWLNDVSALQHDPQMIEVAPEFDAVILMHARGDPATMQEVPIVYEDVVGEVRRFLEQRVAYAVAHGVAAEKLLVDPGIGFGKLLEHNLALSRSLDLLRGDAAGVVYGPSRKRFLGELTGIRVPAERDRATLGAVSFAASRGADIVRVHDVKGTVEALQVVDALARAQGST